MAKLTKAQLKEHARAEELLSKDVLTFDDRWEVYEKWNEAAEHSVSAAGAFFTPIGLANDFSFDVGGSTVIDLCAGIGILSFMHWRRLNSHGTNRESAARFVCVEKNPDYVRVGKKLLPEAEWICADVFDLDIESLGRFDVAISNPPFGNWLKKTSYSGSYTGPMFEFGVIELASRVASNGTFIIPQGSAPFSYSGQPCYNERLSKEYAKFLKDTGIRLDPGCGIDTSYYREDWKNTNVLCEVVCTDFENLIGKLPL